MKREVVQRNSILWCSAFFMVQLSHPYMTKGKTIALIIQTFVGKVMSLLFHMLSRFVIAFLPRSKGLLISWLQSHQAPPSLGFSRQEHWSGLPFPSTMRESEVTQSCPTLSDPMDCSLPGSSVHGILQARVLEWGAIAFSVIVSYCHVKQLIKHEQRSHHSTFMTSRFQMK